MRKLSIGLVLLALVMSGLIGMYFSGAFDTENQSQSVSVEVGQPAPDFTLYNQKGEGYSLSSLKGQVVLVNFWATWCPPCRSEIPSMEELYVNYHRGGLELLAVNIEPEGPEIIDAFTLENPHSFPVIFDRDGKVQNRFGVFKFPETFIINKQGIIVERVVGAIDWTAPEVLSYLNKLMQE